MWFDVEAAMWYYVNVGPRKLSICGKYILGGSRCRVSPIHSVPKSNCRCEIWNCVNIELEESMTDGRCMYLYGTPQYNPMLWLPGSHITCSLGMARPESDHSSCV